MKDSTLYHNEVTDMLEKAAKELPDCPTASWFLEIIQARLLDFPRQKQVFVLGGQISPEIFAAFPISPIWLRIGSLKAMEFAPPDLPRDTDPVSRSSYGLLCRHLEEAGDSLIVILLTNDNARKLSYLLKRAGRNVLPISIPPSKTAEGIEEWERQMFLLLQALTRFTGRRITKRHLQQAAQWAAQAESQFHTFEKLAAQHPHQITGLYKMLVSYSFFCAPDIREWAGQLSRLNQEIRALPVDNSRRECLLLLGSPILFPNYKIPLLIQELGMYILKDFTFPAFADSPADIPKDFTSRWRRFFLNDVSPAYIRNDALYQAVNRYVESEKPDGVVYHVLKGQIGYDFELERFDELFSRLDIPIIRLETDYSYQDIEQLRLRLEAFAEILGQRRTRKGGT